jgi:hypothetical protein
MTVSSLQQRTPARNRPVVSLANGALRLQIAFACDKKGVGLAALTVLSERVDPYRLDTPANHRDGAWVAKQLETGFGSKRTHWRGLHYSLVMRKRPVKKPDGSNFENTEEDWTWLSEVAGKAARWLGDVSFDRITDQRNAAPVIHRRPREVPVAWADASLGIDFPDVVGPRPYAQGFVPRQAFQFVMFGEKASLEEVVSPIAERFEADLYLVTGEISDTYIYQFAKDANEDGRPLIVFTLSDCDPSGWQMPVSIARKLQAFRDLFFPNLRFEVVPVALTVEQAKRLDLPSTPLKKGEKRADRWKAAFGIEQTEIDALTTPERMDDLREIVRQAFVPYFNFDLERRVAEAEVEWTEAAEEAIDAQVDRDRLEAARSRAAVLRTEISDLNAELEAIAEDIELPPVEVPEAETNDTPRQALVHLDHDWTEATEALIAHKTYGAEKTET